MSGSLRLAAAAAAALVVLLAGCGDDDDTATDATEIELEELEDADDGTVDDADEPDDEAIGQLHACELLTDDEIEAQLAASESEGQETSGEYTIEHEESNVDEGHSSCTYHWETVDQIGGMPQAVGDFQVGLVLAERIEATRAGSQEEPIEGVDGADEAFVISEIPYAIVGDVAVSIVNLQRGDDAAIELLKAAVARA